MVTTSALVTGSDFGRKLVEDAVWLPCCQSQSGAPELTPPSFLFLVSLHKMKYLKVQLICHNVITPPLNGHRIKKRVISHIQKWFLMLISHVSVLATLTCSCFLRRCLDDLCFPDFDMFTLAVLSWRWFIHASLSCQLLPKNIEHQEG